MVGSDLGTWTRQVVSAAMSGAPTSLRQAFASGSGAAAHGRLWEYPPSMHPRSGGQSPWSMIPKQPKWKERKLPRADRPPAPEKEEAEAEPETEPEEEKEDFAAALAAAAEAAAAAAAEAAAAAAAEEEAKRKVVAPPLAEEAPKPIKKRVPKRLGPVVPSRWWLGPADEPADEDDNDDKPPAKHDVEMIDWQPSRRPLCYFYEAPETFDETLSPAISPRMLAERLAETQAKAAAQAAAAEYEATHRAGALRRAQRQAMYSSMATTDGGSTSVAGDANADGDPPSRNSSPSGTRSNQLEEGGTSPLRLMRSASPPKPATPGAVPWPPPIRKPPPKPPPTITPPHRAYKETLSNKQPAQGVLPWRMTIKGEAGSKPRPKDAPSTVRSGGRAPSLLSSIAPSTAPASSIDAATMSSNLSSRSRGEPAGATSAKALGSGKASKGREHKPRPPSRVVKPRRAAAAAKASATEERARVEMVDEAGLPTPMGVGMASAEVALATLCEFGCTQPALAEAALARLHTHLEVTGKRAAKRRAREAAAAAAAAAGMETVDGKVQVKPLWGARKSEPAGGEVAEEATGAQAEGAQAEGQKGKVVAAGPAARQSGGEALCIGGGWVLRNVDIEEPSDPVDALERQLAATHMQAIVRGRAGRRRAATALAALEADYAAVDQADPYAEPEADGKSPSSASKPAEGEAAEGEAEVAEGAPGSADEAPLRSEPRLFAAIVRAMEAFSSNAELQASCCRVVRDRVPPTRARAPLRLPPSKLRRRP